MLSVILISEQVIFNPWVSLLFLIWISYRNYDILHIIYVISSEFSLSNFYDENKCGKD